MSSIEPKRFKYRGVGFHKTEKGYWIFDGLPPGRCGWSYWSVFFTEDENRAINDMPDEDAVGLIHKAIDRMFLGNAMSLPRSGTYY